MAETILYRKRWLFALVLFYYGASFGYCLIFLGIINTTLARYLDVAPHLVDWMSLSLNISILIFMIPIGLFGTFKPLTVRMLSNCGLLLIVCGCVINAAVLIVGKQPKLIVVAQLMIGMGSSLRPSLIFMVNTMWFAEKEQGSIFGMAWATIGIGNTFATLFPALLLWKMRESSLHAKAVGLAYGYVVLAAIGFALFALIWKCTPSIPPLPPSQVEAERRNLLMNEERPLGLTFIRNFLLELKRLLVNRTACTVILAFGLLYGLLSPSFLLFPPIKNVSHNVTFANMKVTSYLMNEKHAFILIFLSFGTIFGALTVGFAVDRMKSYFPLAAILSPATLVAALGTLVSNLCSSDIGTIIFLFFTGFAISGTTTFLGETLKQYMFADVSEAILGMALGISANLFTIICVPIFRYVMESNDNSYFFLLTCVVSAICGILILSVKPSLNRYLSEERAIVSERRQLLERQTLHLQRFTP